MVVVARLAASVAGVRKLLQSGTISRGERVVAVLTGHLLKDPDAVVNYHTARTTDRPYANPPIEIEPRVSEVERAMRA